MITRLLLLAMLLPLAGLSQVQAQADGRYIEVTGTSEIEIVPDRIHYIIEIREYFEEEFDGKAGPNRRNIVQRSLWTGSNRDCGKCCMTRVSLRMPSVRRRSVIIGVSKGRTFWWPRPSILRYWISNRLMKSSNVWIPKASIPCASVNWKTRTCCPTIKKEKSQP